MKKQEKIFLVQSLTEELKGAKTIVLVNYSGLNVKNQQELKKRLKEVGASFLVVKNTLLKRAGDSAKIESQLLQDTVLQGQTALIIANEDPISPLTVLGKFAKEFVSEAGYSVPSMKVGIVEGTFQDSEALIKLASLPGRDALLGQVLGVLIVPSYGLVSTLNANMQKLLYVLNEKATVR